MQAVNIRELKNNPTAAVRHAAAGTPVIVMNRNNPQAVLCGLEGLNLPDLDAVKEGLAVSLYRDAALSLGAAAKVANMTVSDFLAVLAAQGIPVGVRTAEEFEDDLATAEQWLNAAP